MINALSFRLFSWYSSGVFALIVVVLILICAIVSNGVSPLITTLFSSGTTLLISYNNGSDYDGLLIALNIKPDVCSLNGYSPDVYSLPT